MVSAEDRQKSIDKQKSDALEQDKKQKEIQDRINQSARAGPGQQNRGYNYETRLRSGEVYGSNPQSGEYHYNPQTGQMSGNIPNDTIQRMDNPAVRNELSKREIDRQVADLENRYEKSQSDYQARVASGAMSNAEKRKGNPLSASLAVEIKNLKAQSVALSSKPSDRTPQYTGVMATSGKIYSSAAEAAKQGATVAKTRTGKDVTFEGDIRSTAGFAQSNRGYSYLDTTDKKVIHGAEKGEQFVIERQPEPLTKTGKVPVQADYSKNFVTGGYEPSTGFPQVTNDKVIYNRLGSGTAEDPFRSKDPEENQLSSFANPVWIINTPSGQKTFQDKKDLELYIKSGGQIVESKEKMSPYNDNFIIRKFLSVPQQQGPNKQAGAYSIDLKESLGGKDESVYLPAGSLQYLYGEQRKDEFNTELSREFQGLSKEGEESWKKTKTGKPLDVLIGSYGQAGAATGRWVIGGIGFVKNYAEQTYAPFLAEKLGVRYTPPQPVNLESPTSGMVVLPYNFEKGRITSRQEWDSRQADYIKKYGPVEYGTGLVLDFGGLTGIPKASVLAVKGIGVVGRKAISPALGKAAKSAAITNAPSSIFKGQYGSPSANWDVLEKVTPVGFRKNLNKPNVLNPTTQSNKPVPNPFGKEREPFYTVGLVAENAIKRGKKLVEEIPTVIDVITPIEIIGLGKAVKADAKLIAQKTKSGLRGTAEAFDKWNKTPSQIPEGYKLKDTRLERMRNMMWPDEPILPVKPKSTSPPPGYKAKLSMEVLARNTKQNIKDNLQVLNDIDKDIGGRITNPILKAIKKDQKTPNRSINRINFGRKSQVPNIPDETPRIIIKAKEFAEFSAFKISQNVAKSRKELSRTGGIMRDLFYPTEPKKETVPFVTKQELKNWTSYDNAKETQDFLNSLKTEKTQSRDFIEEFREIKKRDYNIVPKPHQKFLQKEEITDNLKSQQRENIKKRRLGDINLPERNIIPRIKYQETKLIDRILSGLAKSDEFKGEYMPRSKGKSKPNRNIFIEDNAKETQDFLDAMKKEKTGSREFIEEFREPVKGEYKTNFIRETEVEKLQRQKKANLEARLRGKVNLEKKKQRFVTIEQVKLGEEKGLKEFVKEGEKRKGTVDLLRSEKKLELPERNVSIFKVPYKETELDKILAQLGKKDRIKYKKATYDDKTPSQKDFKGEPLKKRWEDERRKDIGSGRQITIMREPEQVKELKVPEPEIKTKTGKKIDKDKEEKKILIIPPTPKEERKRRDEEIVFYDVPLSDKRPTISARSMTGTSLSSLMNQGLRVASPQKSGLRIDNKLGQKLYSPQKTKIFEVTKTGTKLSEALKQPQKLKERQKTRTPEINKPVTKQTTKITPKEKPRQLLKMPEILVPPPRLLFPLPPKPNPKKPRGKSGRKGMNFIAASSQNQIEGFFRREDVIYGKAADKLVGKKEVFNPKFGLGFSNKKKLRL